MKRICIAPNAFKGTLTAMQAAECIERGLKKAIPGVEFIKIPVADGGDGTAEAIARATGGQMIAARVSDPLGRPVRARWGLSGDGATAVIELATASGLALLTPEERDPRGATTRGTGELLRAALEKDVRRVVIGIGGSATNDGGAGIARALGIRFLDKNGKELPDGGAALARLARIDMDGVDPRLKKVSIDIACDVDNPLTGPRGAVHVYGPQKGATPKVVEQLDAALAHLAEIIWRDLGVDVERTPGAGAAGGAGAGLMAFLGARLRPGAELVMQTLDLRARLAGCDLVITGEGRMDAQTAFGKAPAAVARAARALGVPAIAICGSLSGDLAALRRLGLLACFSALEELMDESALAPRAGAMLTRCAENVGLLIKLGGKL